MGMPAARITDMHVCPMVTGLVPHVGGPISGPCAPTVLIGGLPAARITDMAVCVGPPDVIVRGAATVLIAGLPAARLGDSTAHGGVIVLGMPTVLIGDSGGGDGGGGVGAGMLGATGTANSCFCDLVQAAALAKGPARLAIVNALQDQLKEANPEVAAQLQTRQHALEMAMLSNASYNPDDPSLLPPGYALADAESLEGLGISPDSIPIDASVYTHQKPDGSQSLVVAFRGTASDPNAKSLMQNAVLRQDVWTDIAQAAGGDTEAYRNSTAFARTVADAQPDVEFTGHSKGGGQAAAAAAATGKKASTYNAAGVHRSTLVRAGVTSEQQELAKTNITAFSSTQDPLNRVQDHRGAVLSGLTAAANFAAGLLGAAAVATLAAGGAIPRAMGQRISVQAKPGTGPLEGHSIGLMIESMEAEDNQWLKAACDC